MAGSKTRASSASGRTWTNWLVYMAVRVVVAVLQAIPPALNYSIARWLGGVAPRVDRRRVAVAKENLRRAFPGRYTDEHLTAIVRAVYVHFASLVAEMAITARRLRQTTWRRHIVARNQAGIVELVLSGRPVILLTAHFGNWEMAGYTMAVFGFKPYSVARSLDNPYLEQLLRMFRTRTGQEIIYKRGAFDAVSAVLEAGAMVAFLSDQDAGQRGVFVEFFGRPASSHKGVALLALEHDAPIAIGFARRLGSGFSFEVWLEQVIEPGEYRQLPDPVWSITQECARVFERVVRRNPDQYLWLHRRWKHQPVQTGEPQAA